MSRFILSISLIPFLFFSNKSFGEDSAFKISGYCQNLVINNIDYTKSCNPDFHLIEYENGRINYFFWISSKGAIVFAGENEVANSPGFYSRIEIDKIYINDQEIQIEGQCSILGNAEYGFTVTCRSNDTPRRYSALFFSIGNMTQQLK
jgi:hypothetical protein